MKSFDPNKAPFALGKITQVPNHRKMIEGYILEYDNVYDDLDRWMDESITKKQICFEIFERMC